MLRPAEPGPPAQGSGFVELADERIVVDCIIGVECVYVLRPVLQDGCYKLLYELLSVRTRVQLIGVTGKLQDDAARLLRFFPLHKMTRLRKNDQLAAGDGTGPLVCDAGRALFGVQKPVGDESVFFAKKDAGRAADAAQLLVDRLGKHGLHAGNDGLQVGQVGRAVAHEQQPFFE